MHLEQQHQQYLMQQQQDPNMMHQMQMQHEAEDMEQQFYVSLVTAVTQSEIFILTLYSQLFELIFSLLGPIARPRP